MPTGVPISLALPDDELPDITDAGVGLTVLMVASLIAERERQALTARLADSIEARDWAAMAALTRRLAAVPGPVPRMADVARAGIERYDAGQADPADGAEISARSRRALVRAVNWLERRFWPLYGTVRTVVPPAPPDAPEAIVTPLRETPSAKAKACRKTMRARLYLLDGEIARLETDRTPAAATARRIMLTDRNAHAARCRACGGCRLADAPLTRDIPAL